LVLTVYSSPRNNPPDLKGIETRYDR
jgi:hypothetical protein